VQPQPGSADAFTKMVLPMCETDSGPHEYYTKTNMWFERERQRISVVLRRTCEWGECDDYAMLRGRVGPRPSKHFLTSTRGLLLFLSLASTATAPLATSNRVSCKNSGYGVATPKTIVVVSARAMGEEERERHLLKDIDIDEIRSAGRAYKAKQDRAAILAVLEDPGFCFRSGESRTKHDAYVMRNQAVGHMSCARELVPPCPPCISPPTPLAALTGFSLCTRHWALGCWWLVGRGRGPGPGAGASSSRRGFLIF
jgi:hypothetical protein